MQEDEKVPNNDEYVEKCFMLNITKDGLNFQGNIFNTLFVSIYLYIETRTLLEGLRV